MSTIPQTAPQQVIEKDLARPWSAGKRVAFRFFSIYFVLYSLTTQIGPSLLPIPKVDIRSLGQVRPVTTLVTWTAAHVFSSGKRSSISAEAATRLRLGSGLLHLDR